MKHRQVEKYRKGKSTPSRGYAIGWKYAINGINPSVSFEVA